MSSVVPARAYALCPASLPEWQLRSLTEGADSEDFRLVPPRQRVTTYWLDCCIEQQQALAAAAAAAGALQQRGWRGRRPPPAKRWGACD